MLTYLAGNESVGFGNHVSKGDKYLALTHIGASAVRREHVVEQQNVAFLPRKGNRRLLGGFQNLCNNAILESRSISVLGIAWQAFFTKQPEQRLAHLDIQPGRMVNQNLIEKHFFTCLWMDAECWADLPYTQGISRSPFTAQTGFTALPLHLCAAVGAEK